MMVYSILTYHLPSRRPLPKSSALRATVRQPTEYGLWLCCGAGMKEVTSVRLMCIWSATRLYQYSIAAWSVYQEKWSATMQNGESLIQLYKLVLEIRAFCISVLATLLSTCFLKPFAYWEVRITSIVLFRIKIVFAAYILVAGVSCCMRTTW